MIILGKERGIAMGQKIVIAVLTILFYITSLLGGNTNTTDNNSLRSYTPSSQQEKQLSSIIGQTALVLGDKVTVRSGPGTDYLAISSVNKGLEVTLLEAKNEWY